MSESWTEDSHAARQVPGGGSVARRSTPFDNSSRLRTGLHYGEVVERAGDVFGAAVNLTARVAAQAKGGQVLTTKVVADAARASGVDVTPLGRIALRNIKEPVELFAVGLFPSVGEVVDPVCRMRVAPEQAAGRLHVGGADYWFYSLACVRASTADPDAYPRHTD